MRKEEWEENMAREVGQKSHKRPKEKKKCVENKDRKTKKKKVDYNYACNSLGLKKERAFFVSRLQFMWWTC